MSEFDQEMTQRLSTERDALDAEHRAGLPRAKAVVFRRARRRRVATATAGVALVSAVTAGAFALPFPGDGPPPLPPPNGPVFAADARGPQEPDDGGLGLWPSLRAEDAEPYCEMLLSRTSGVAVSFVNDLLGWNNVALQGQERNGDHVEVTLADLPSTYVGGESKLPVRAQAIIGVERLGSGDCWWVDSVRTPDGGSMTAAQHGGALRVEVSFPPDVRRADVVVREAGVAGRKYLVGETGQTVFETDTFEDDAHVIAIWRTDEGYAVGATALTLPGGS